MYNDTTSINHKKCATCRRWPGCRKFVFVGANTQVNEVDAMADKKNYRA